jgi:NAD(P)-dependent dehydrogenase (short-subunit alcohol dehydrogenase family)
MRDKVVVITGSNSGIGRVTATEIAKMGAQVVMVCRNKDKSEAVRDDINALTGLNNCDLFLCDISSKESVRQFGKAFRAKYDKVDVLINNAGLIAEKREVNEDGMELMIATNHLGYFLVTHEILPCLKRAASARIVNVASLAHRFSSFREDDMNCEHRRFISMQQYGLSKLCNILFSNYLAKELTNSNITVNSLHPGNIQSNFGKGGDGIWGFLIRNFGFVLISPEKGAQTTIHLATSPEVQGKTGLYWYRKNPVIPSGEAISSENARKLWEWSLAQTGIKEYGIV